MKRSRQHTTENRKQRTESKEQRATSRECFAACCYRRVGGARGGLKLLLQIETGSRAQLQYTIPQKYKTDGRRQQIAVNRQ
jgi:hypothetical protein